MTLRLPKLLDDGCVLQAGVDMHIWGTGDPGRIVLTRLADERHMVQVKDDGTWNAPYGPIEAGGPYELTICYEDGAERISRQCYAGEVFLCSGQSNMELPMAWVRADYPQEWDRDPDPLLRQYKVIPDYDFKGPRDDHDRAFWQGCDADTLDDFSALAYFFGRRIRQWLGVPVGLLNISLGGSPIESWMDIDTLRAFPEALASLEPYLGDGVASKRSLDSVAERDRWYQALGYEAVADAHHEWLPLIAWDCPESKNIEPRDVAWHDIRLPGWYKDRGLAGFRGEITMRKTVFLPPSDAGKPALLRLGTMNDADHTWVNGVLVGGRSNVYEPRDYPVAAGVLRAGANEIRMRLVVERPGGRVTPGKRMTLTIGDDVFDLSGIWQYAVTAEADRDCPFEDFVRWKPTGLYNAMLAPCFPYAVRAVLWYQGESNAGRPGEYEALLTAMLKDWRVKFADEDLPFFIMQLPNFMQTHQQPVESGWAGMREAQRQVTLKLPNTSLVVAIDLGEWNDIHPLNKKELARRVALQVKKKVYGHKDIVHSGPLCTAAAIEGGKVILSFEAGTDGLMPVAQLKGFALAGTDGRYKWAEATVEGNKVIVWSEGIAQPTKVRYAWDDNPQEANLKNKAGLPASPFQMDVP